MYVVFLLTLGAEEPPELVVNAHRYGARGDGQTDDTAALQAVLDRHVGALIYGAYVF